MSTTPGHLLLFRNTDWQNGLSPQEIDTVMNQFMAWFDSMQSAGLIKSANPLESQGKLVTADGVTDGPFAESKEAIGGYFWLDVDTMEEALAFARKNPALKYGALIEVRPVAEECPVERERRARAAEPAVA